MWSRPYSWARQLICGELAEALAVGEARHFANHDELKIVFEGRECLLVLYNFAATLTIDLKRRVLPESIQVHETSLWGHQKEEAWISGEAIRTGHANFDQSFLVLGTRDGIPPKREDMRELCSELREGLIELRPHLRDAYVLSDSLKLQVERGANAGAPPRKSFAWALGCIFLDFDRMPTSADLRSSLVQAVEIAERLEGASRQENE